MNEELDVTKPVQTRDGREARLFCTDMKGPYPLVGAVKGENGIESAYCWAKSGIFRIDGEEGAMDLINKPIKRKVRVCIFRYGTVCALILSESATADTVKRCAVACENRGNIVSSTVIELADGENVL